MRGLSGRETTARTLCHHHHAYVFVAVFMQQQYYRKWEAYMLLNTKYSGPDGVLGNILRIDRVFLQVDHQPTG